MCLLEKMWNKLFLCFMVIQIVGQFVKVEGKSMAKNGKGKAFGSGILAGGLAGAAVGHLLTRNDKPKEIHHHHHFAEPSPIPTSPVNINPIPTIPPKPITTIEKGQTLSNGCYKQTIREPDQNDNTRFIETEQLICPQNLATPSENPFVHLVPVVAIQQPPSTGSTLLMIQVPVQIQPAEPNQVPTNVSATPDSTSTTSLQPLPANNTTSSVQATVNYTLPQPVLVYPVHPVIPPLGQPQAMILSKTNGVYAEDKKKKNVAEGLIANSFGIILSVILVQILF